MKYFTKISHKRNLNLFDVKPCIPAFREPEGGLVVLLLRMTNSLAQSLTVSSVKSSLSPLSYFPQSKCNSPVLLHLLLELDTYGDVDPLGVFQLFLKMVVDLLLQN